MKRALHFSENELNHSKKSAKQCSIAFLFVMLFGLSAQAQNTYYWVGGTGNWNDLTHWATTSGGLIKHTIVPSVLDHVMFDVNSFSASGQTVTVNQEAFCKDFKWVNVLNNPTFNGAGYNLNVAGNFEVTGGRFTFNHVNGNLSITGNLLVDGADMAFTKSGGTVSVTGNWTMQNNAMSFSRTSGTTTVGGNMTFQNMTPTSFNINSGAITVTGDFLMNTAPFNFNPTGQTMTVNGNFSIINGASTFTHSNALSVKKSFTLSSMVTFNQSNYVIFTATTTGNTITSAGKSFTYVRFNGSGGEWILQDNFKATQQTEHYTGIFRSNGKSVDYGLYFNAVDNGTVRTLDYTGTDTVRVQYQFRVNSNVNTVLTMGGAVLLMHTANWSDMYIDGGGKTFGNVMIRHLYNINSYTEIRFRDNNTVYGNVYMIVNNGTRLYKEGTGNTFGNVTIQYINASVTSTSWNYIFGTNTFGNFTILSNGMNPYFYCDQNNTFGNVSLVAGTTWQIAGSRVQTLTGLTAIGNCLKFPYIYASSGTATINDSNGGTNALDFVRLSGITFGGAGTTWTAANVLDDGGNTGIAITPLPTQTYYWIGGVGNWNETAHWSLSSGGSASGCLPTRVDHVVFDNNSFPGSNQTVTLNLAGEVNNMTWTAGVNASPNFNGSQNLTINGDLNVAGNMDWNITGQLVLRKSITLNSAMTWAHNNIVYFSGSTAGNTINMAGKIFINRVIFDNVGNTAAGAWTLAGDFKVAQTTSVAYVTFNDATFVSAGYKVDFGDIFDGNANLPKVLDFTGTDTVRVKRQWQITTSTNATLTMGTAVMLLRQPASEGNNMIFDGGSKTYYDVVFDAQQVGSYTLYIRNNSMTFRDVYFRIWGAQPVRLEGGSCTYRDFYAHYFSTNTGYAPAFEVTANSNIFTSLQFTSNFVKPVLYPYGFNTINTLKLHHGMTALFGANQTQTLQSLIALGTCTRNITLQSINAGTQTTLTDASGSNNIDYVALKDMKVQGGATWNATNVVNNGNNTGWNIVAAAPLTYYWIGGTGNWSDASHWGLSSGGVSSGCLPNVQDNVVFDINSFTGTGQSVNLTANAVCRNMTWTAGVTLNPTFQGNFEMDVQGDLLVLGVMTWIQNNILYPRGDFKLNTGVTWQHAHYLEFFSDSTNNVVNTANKTLLHRVRFGAKTTNSGPKWTLGSDYKLQNNNSNYITYIYDGTWKTDGYEVDAGWEFYAADNYVRTIDLTGTDTVRTQNAWRIVANANTTFIHGGATILMVTSIGTNQQFIGGNKTYQDVVIRHSSNGYTQFTGANTYRDLYIRNTSGNNRDIYFDNNPQVFRNVDIDHFTGGQLAIYFRSSSHTFNNFVVETFGNATNYLELQTSNTFNTLDLPNGFNMTMLANTTQTIANFIPHSTCLKRSSIIGNNATNSKISQASGTINIEWINLTNHQVLGGATFNATDATITGTVTGWNYVIEQPITLFWVGDSGNWSDANHWAFVSGGPGNGCVIPLAKDNAVFDAASFTAAGQNVSLNVTGACKNMIWNNVAFTPSFGTNNQLTVNGDLYINSNMVWNQSGNLLLNGNVTFSSGMTWNHNASTTFSPASAGNYTLDFAGKTLINTNTFSGNANATWTLLSDYKAATGVTNNFQQGKLYSNGYKVDFGYALNFNYTNSKMLDFTGTDTVRVRREWYANPSGTTLNMGGAVLLLQTNQNDDQWFRGGNLTYGDIVVRHLFSNNQTINFEGNNTVGEVSLNITNRKDINMNGNSSFGGFTLIMNHSNTASIPQFLVNGSNTFNTFVVLSLNQQGPEIKFFQNNTFGSFVSVGRNSRLRFGSTKTQTFTGVVQILGTGGFPIFINATTDGSQATLTKASGDLCFDYVWIKDINATGGATYQGGINGIDLGNNLGINFANNCQAYYWVGNSGNWSDYANHWATSSGGTTFHAQPPTLIDDVYFDANSFTAAGHTVTLDIIGDCRNMDWLSSLFSPTLAGPASNLNIFGGLVLSPFMSQNWGGSWNFKAQNGSTYSIDVQGKTLTNVGINTLSGSSYKLVNDLKTSNSIDLIAGGFLTQGNAVNTKEFNMVGADVRSLTLGSSKITITNGKWDVQDPANLSITPGTSEIIVQSEGSSSHFYGGGKTYRDLRFNTTTTMSGSLTGSNTFNVLRVLPGVTLSLESGSTQTSGNLIATGTCTKGLTINATTPGSAATFSQSSGTVTSSFVNFQDNTATGGATFNANQSNDLGNNTGWVFANVPNLAITMSATDATCPTPNNGTVTANVTGGVTPYAYKWNTLATLQTLTNLSAGTYTVTVTDAAGCSSTASASVSQPASYNFGTSTTGELICFGASDGDVSISTTGALSPLTYLWSNSATTATQSGLVAGTYNVTVTDAAGCKAINLAQVNSRANINAGISVTTAKCINSPIGFNASGTGTGLSYSWNFGDGNTGSGQSVTNTYTVANSYNVAVTVTDVNACQSIATVPLIIAPALALSATVNNVTSCAPAVCNGSVVLAPSGGLAPYQFFGNEFKHTFDGTTISTSIFTRDNNAGAYTQNNELTVSGTNQWNKRIFTNGTFARAVGNEFYFKYYQPVNTYNMIGWYGNSTASTTNCYTDLLYAFYFAHNSQLNIYEDGSDRGNFTANVPGGYTTNTWYECKIVLKSTGADYYLRKLGVGNYALIYASSYSTETNLRLGMTVYGTGPVVTDDWTVVSYNPTTTALCTGNYTFNVLDANGCTASYAATVGVTDVVQPTAICQNVTANLNSSGTYTLTTAQVNNGSSDDCGIGNLSLNASSFDCSNIGANVVTLTVTDNSSNTNTCTSTVTVGDISAPDIICPANQTLNITSGCDAALEDYVPLATASDNCNSAPATSQSPAPGTVIAATQLVTLTANDGNGNTQTCSFNVALLDNTAPVASCISAITLQLNASGSASASVVDINNTSSDNCGITSTALSGQTVYTCADAGNDFTVTLTVSDAGGNTSSCTTLVSVYDDENPCCAAPEAVCETSLQIFLDGSGMASITVNDIDAGSTADCGISSMVIDVNNFSCADLNSNPHTVTLTITDGNNVTDQCSTSVTITDNAAPAISCPAAQTIPMGVDCEAIMPSFSAISASDNCSYNVTQSPASGDLLTGVGPITVTLTATDQGSLTSNCTFTLNKTDGIAPSITCPSLPVEQNNDGGQCNAVVHFYSAASANDYCDASPTIVYSPASGTSFNVGNTTVTATATDDSGNTASCEFVVKVKDAEAPTVTCPTVAIAQNADMDLCNAVVTFSVSSADNCDNNLTINLSQASGTTFPVGTSNVFYTATDDANNSASCSFAVVISDTQVPTVTCPADRTGDTDPNLCSAVHNFTATASDNCNASPTITFSPVSGSAFDLGVTIVTAIAGDGNGNTASCTFNITVEDNQLPVLTCPSAVNQAADAGTCNTNVSFSVSATDNCNASPSLTGSHSSGVFTVGSTTVTYTADDGNGNTASCSFNVIVTDNQLPSISCPANIVQNNDANQCSAVVNYTVTASDNCGTPAISYSKASGTVFQLGATTVTATANDGNGNMVSCNFTVTVNDTEVPAITCPANITVNNTTNQCQAAVTVPAPTATDNCSTFGASITTMKLYINGVLVSTATGGPQYVGSNPIAIGQHNGGGCNGDIKVDEVRIWNIARSASQIAGNMNNSLIGNELGLHTYYNCDQGTANGTNTGISTLNDLAPFAGTNNGTLQNVALTGSVSNFTTGAPFAGSGNALALGNGNDMVIIGSPIAANSSYTKECWVFARQNGCDNILSSFNEPFWLNGALKSGHAGNYGFISATASFPLNQWVHVALTFENGVNTGTFLNNFNNTANASGTYPVGTTNLVWTAKDATNNSATCLQTVTVVDNQQPNLSCPATQSIVLNASCEATLGNYTSLATKSDNCTAAANIVMSQTPASGTAISGFGPMNVVIMAQDAAGNQRTCNFTVNKLDQQAPTVTCPAGQIVALGNDCTVAMPNYTQAATTTDNCGAPSVTQSVSGASTFTGIQTKTVTLTATDVAGNTATCSFNVTSEDQSAPSINCPATQTVVLNASCTGTLGNYTGLTGVADNCATTLTQSPASSTSLSGTGTQVVTMTATDISGNTASCAFNVNKVDNTDPVITHCPDDRPIYLNQDCQVVIPDLTGELTATDNCSATTASQSSAGLVLSLAHGSTTTAVINVSDASNNTVSCSVTLTVTDNTAPNLTCPAAQSIALTANCAATLPDYTLNAVASDNCTQAGDIVLTQSATTVSIAGTETITITATDEAGNAQTCQFALNKVDNTAPTAVCNDIVIELVDRDPYTLSQAQIDAIALGSGDNCAFTYAISAGLTQYDCDNRNSVVSVTLTVTDASGNTATCVGQVMITDPNSVCNEPPVAVCQNITVDLNSDCTVGISNTAVNNGSSDPDNDLLTYSVSPNNFSGVGTTTVTLTVSDGEFSDDCTATVTTVDITAPVANIATLENVEVECSVTLETPTATDACDGTITATTSDPTTYSAQGTYTVSWTYTDGSGNSSSQTQTVIVDDNTPLVITCPAMQTQVLGSNNCQTTLSNYIAMAVTTDNCGSVTVTQSPTIGSVLNGEQTVAVTLTGTDIGGNSASCTFNVEVQDNTNPAAVCQDVTVQLDANGNGSLTAAQVNNGSSDACGIASSTLDITAFDCGDIGNGTGGILGNALKFDGSNDYTVRAPLTALGTGDFTFEFWYKANSHAAFPILFAQDQTGIGTPAFRVEINSNNNSMSFFQNSSGASVTNFTPANSLTINTWTHYAIVRSGNTYRSYINGVLKTTTTASGTPNFLGNNFNFRIGARQTGALAAQNPFNGTIDEFRVWNVARTQSEIQANLFNSLGSQANLYINYPFNQGTAGANNAGISTLNDASGNNLNSTLTNFTLNGVNSNWVSGAPTPATAGPEVTLSVTDVNGNTSTCTANVTVEDHVAPVATCQNVTVQLNAAGAASTTAAAVNNGSSDACGIQGVTLNNSSFTCANLGANTVTLTATDNNGNTATCTATITVQDNIAPTALCKNTIVALGPTGIGSITPASVNNGSSDNCFTNFALDVTTFDCDDALIGVSTVILTVTDNSGNSHSCTATVTVEDNLNPVIVCPSGILTVALNADCSKPMPDFEPSLLNATDNCSYIVTQTPAPGTPINGAQGMQFVHMAATDPGGLSSVCDILIDVVDNTPPTAVCQNLTVALNIDGDASINANMVNNGSSDGCGIYSKTLSQTAFNCAHVGTNLVTLTVKDVNNNTSTCTATIMVEDNNAPAANCNNFVVHLDANGHASITTAMVDDNSWDACGVASATINQSAFNCSQVGVNTVILTVTDVNNNVSTCEAEISVLDVIQPTTLCKNATVVLDADGEGVITVADVNNNSFDNCGIFSLNASPNTFTCGNTGDNTVTLTATDVNGNVSTCNAVVSVEDNTDPVALCQNVTVALNASGTGTISAAQVDGGSSDICGIQSLGLSLGSFDCGQIGDHIAVLTVTDNNNNVSTCSATISVVDLVAPEAVCHDITLPLDAGGNASITVGDIDNNSSDACGIQSVTISASAFDCSQVGVNNVTLTVTDVNGNLSSCIGEVTVVDEIAATAVCQNVTVALSAAGTAGTTAAQVNNGSSDNCGIQSLALSQTAFDCSHLGSNTVTLTVTDVNGNVSTCNATVIVQDNILPVALCRNLTLQLDAAGAVAIAPVDVNNGSSDNCGFTLSLSNSTFGCANVGLNTVTLTNTDAAGNTSTCQASITVKDQVLPNPGCQNYTLALNAQGEGCATAANVAANVSDACGISSIFFLETGGDDNRVSNGTFNYSSSSWQSSNIEAGGGYKSSGGNPGGYYLLKGNNSCNSDPSIKQTIDDLKPGKTYTISGHYRGMGTSTAASFGILVDNQLIAQLPNPGLVWTAFSVTFTATDDDHQISFKGEMNCDATDYGIDNIGVVKTNTLSTMCFDCSHEDHGCDDDFRVGGGGSEKNGTVSGAENNNNNDDDDDDDDETLGLGDHLVTIIVTDNNGNTASCSATISVVDNLAPVADCKNRTVNLNQYGSASITASNIEDDSYDNCGIDHISASPTSFNCSNIGANTVVLSVTDDSGNTGTCYAIVTVKDVHKPNISCLQNKSLALNANCQVVMPDYTNNASVWDNCSVVITQAPAAGTILTGAGSVKVTLTATDPSGNNSAADFYLYMKDGVAPTAICKNITAPLGSNGVVLVTPSMIDNGSYDACGITQMDVPYNCNNSFDCEDVGNAFQVTLQVKDAAGNSSSCTSTVTISGGTLDSDCDGVMDGCDECPGGDDMVDNNHDGKPDCAYKPSYSSIISDWKCGNNKVYMCHATSSNNNPTVTVCVSYSSVSSHLNHGDFIGYCGNSDCFAGGEPDGNKPKGGDNGHEHSDGRDEEHEQDGLGENVQDMLLFPNPTSNDVFIGLDGFVGKSVSLRLFDQMGKQLWILELPNAQDEMVQLHLKELGLASGLYRVMLLSEGKTIVKQLAFTMDN